MILGNGRKCTLQDALYASLFWKSFKSPSGAESSDAYDRVAS